MATLDALMPEGSSIWEGEGEDGGWFWVHAPDWMAWKATGTNTVTAHWYDGTDLTRSSALKLILEDVIDGIEPASADTIHAMGWEAPQQLNHES